MGSQFAKEFGCDYIQEPNFDHIKALNNIIRTKNSINNDRTNTHKDNINNSILISDEENTEAKQSTRYIKNKVL